MSRAARLLDLIQALRRRRKPASAASLAKGLGVSERTIHRDIAMLIAQGAPIEGGAGPGYAIRSGVLLPPLVFDEEQLEALVLGLRWVADQSDDELGDAAEAALGKLAAVLPAKLHAGFVNSGLIAEAGESIPAGVIGLDALRELVRNEGKLRIVYVDATERRSIRTIWPFAIARLDRGRIVVAWCEARQGFRHFRCDRIASAEPTGTRYPRSRAALIAEWQAMESMAQQLRLDEG